MEGIRRALPVLLVALGLGLAGLAAAGPGATLGEAPPREEPPPALETPAEAGTASPTPPPQPAEEFVATEFPGWLTWPVTVFALALAAAAVGVVLFLVVRYLLTERVLRRTIDERAVRPPGGALAAEEVQAAVRAGLADIDAGADPRRAVIACWLRLERAAAAAGTARLAADTPGDLVARLLAGHQVDDAALDRLAAAYRSARYAPDDVDPAAAASAREALAEVAAQLGRAAAAEAGAP